jgi:hypothetical protein
VLRGSGAAPLGQEATKCDQPAVPMAVAPNLKLASLHHSTAPAGGPGVLLRRVVVPAAQNLPGRAAEHVPGDDSVQANVGLGWSDIGTFTLG